MVRIPGPIPVALALAALGMARDSQAQTCNGCPIRTNDYSIDLARGPAIGSNRAVSMGGAHTAMVEGPDGVLWNPAGYAARSRMDPLSWRFDIFGSIAFIYNDFANSGLAPAAPGMPAAPPPYSDYYVGLTGINFQYGRWGIGDMLELHTFVITDPTNPNGRQLWVNMLQDHIGGGYMFLDGQLIVGGGLRITYMNIQSNDLLGSFAPLVRYLGFGLEVGAVWKPEALPMRIGLSGRAGVPAQHETVPVIDGLRRAGSCMPVTSRECYVLPDTINTPWQINIGFAWQFGPRLFSPRWENPRMDVTDYDASMSAARRVRRAEHEALMMRVSQAEQPSVEAAFQRRENVLQAEEERRWWTHVLEGDRIRRARFNAMERRYLTVSTDLEIVGPTGSNGQGMDAFLSGRGHASGQYATLSPRIGFESEPLINQLKVRAGSYLEPSRYANVDPRLHGTLGVDIRLFETTLLGLIPSQHLRLSTYIDYTYNYFDWGLTAGLWE